MSRHNPAFWHHSVHLTYSIRWPDYVSDSAFHQTQRNLQLIKLELIPRLQMAKN